MEGNRGEDYAPRTLVEVLRHRVERHGEAVRELAAYVDSLQPEVMHERQRTMRADIEDLKKSKADRVSIDELVKKVGSLKSSFDRMLIAVVLSCITIVLTVLASNGKL